MPEIRAFFWTASEGGNTRFSTNTDSIAELGAFMVLSPCYLVIVGANVGFSTYIPLTSPSRLVKQK